MNNHPEYLILHHSVSPRDQEPSRTEQGINENHRQRFDFLSKLGWFVGYHYIIFGNGELRQYRAEDEAGAHCKEMNMNFRSIGICLVGDFGSGSGRLNEQPSSHQVETLRNLVQDLQKKYKITDDHVAPHRRFAVNEKGQPYKDCYGSNLPDNPMEWLEVNDLSWAQKFMPEVDWTQVPPATLSAIRALAKRVVWK